MPKKQRKSIALQELRVEFVPISEFKPNEYNPNRQTEDEFEMLKASMREDGFTQPILAMQDGTIIDGEHRWRAAKEMGYERVPVVKVSMTEAQRRIATMRHNRARGQDDTSQVAALFLDLEKLGALDWAQDALRLSDEDVRRLVAMADTVAEDLSRGHTFNQAWEPVERSAYQPPARAGENISYSRPVSSTPDGPERPAGVLEPAAAASVEPPEAMTRRQYVFTLGEAVVVDRVLGEQAAMRLYELCKEVDTRGN
ncbi:MAG: ParB N-terminal domain-containing protein [Chloroflexota bacterium]